MNQLAWLSISSGQTNNSMLDAIYYRKESQSGTKVVSRKANGWSKTSRNFQTQIETGVDKVLSEERGFDYNVSGTERYRVCERTFDLVNAQILKWLRIIDKYIVTKYNDEPSDETYSLRMIIDYLHRNCVNTLVALVLNRGIEFCKV